jgi:pimeloyl-ACP methyl ester carboxylesterase
MASTYSDVVGVYCPIAMSEKILNPITLVLLPGLDGTGNLFANLKAELPQTLKVMTAAYPSPQFLSYSELVSWLSGIVPKDGPYVLLGESFGSALAVKFAATHPRNLIGIMLAVGFVSNPVRSWGPLPKLLSNPLLCQISPPDFFLEYFLYGRGAPESLKLAVRQARLSAGPELLAKRSRECINCDAREELRQVNVALLYLQATEDRLVDKGCLDEIKRIHPETIVNSFRAPHLLFQRKPCEAAKAITRFLDGLMGNVDSLR